MPPLRAAGALPVLALLVAGCLGAPAGPGPGPGSEAPAQDEALAPADAPAPAQGAGEAGAGGEPGLPFEGAGEVFLPPSTGQERMVTSLAFPVNGTGWAGRAELRLGHRIAGVEAPPGLADVLVEVLDPANATLASAQLTMGQPEAALDLADLAMGPHQLVLRSYGGSNGEDFGDYVAWSLLVGAAS